MCLFSSLQSIPTDYIHADNLLSGAGNSLHDLIYLSELNCLDHIDFYIGRFHDNFRFFNRILDIIFFTVSNNFAVDPMYGAFIIAHSSPVEK